MRRATAILTLATAATALAPTGARAAEVTGQPTPLALVSPDAPPVCPAAGAVDGSQLASTVRGLITRMTPSGSRRPPLDDDRAFIAYLGYLSLALTPANAVAVCDPDLAAAGRPAGSFTGTATAPPIADTVGSGLRMRGASLGAPGAAASVGDRFVLPPVGPRSTVDLAVRTPTGSRSVRLGPFETAPAAVSVAGRATAPIAVAELADGRRVEVPVTPPSAGQTKVKVRLGRGSVRFRVTAPARSFLSIELPQRPGDIQIAGFDERGTLTVIPTRGVASFTVRRLDRVDRRIDVRILDAERRTVFGVTCRLAWRGRTLRRASCDPPRATQATQASAPTRSSAPPQAGLPTPSAPSSSPLARAAAAAGLKTVPAALTPVLRIPADEFAPEELAESAPLFGDLTGDARPDFLTGDQLTRPEFLFSGSAGWRRTPARLDIVAEPAIAHDLTGDGVDDLVLDTEGRVVAGRAAWGEETREPLDLRSARPLGPGDLAVVQGQSDALGRDVELVAIDDSTGDGRPEVGLAAVDEGGLAVFDSASLPLGRTTRLPFVQTSAIAQDIATIASLETLDLEATGSDTPEGPTSQVRPFRGGAVVSTSTVVGKGAAARSTLAFRSVGGGPSPLTQSALVTLDLRGQADVVDYDRASGTALVRTRHEACTRRRDCVTRFRRVGADGAVTATVSVRSRSSQIGAVFTSVGTGPGPDVLVHDDESFTDGSATGPGEGGTVALWRAGPGGSALSELPVLGSGRRPLLVPGRLLTWVAPNGVPFHAGYVSTADRKPRPALALIAPAR